MDDDMFVCSIQTPERAGRHIYSLTLSPNVVLGLTFAGGLTTNQLWHRNRFHLHPSKIIYRKLLLILAGGDNIDLANNLPRMF